MKKTSNRQENKRALREEIRQAEQEFHEQMSEEYLAFEEYMQNMEGYDYELDSLAELARDYDDEWEEVFTGSCYDDVDDFDPYPLYDDWY